MCSPIQQNLTKEELNLSSPDLDVLNSIYNSPNGLEDEIFEFFREVAALQGKSVDETKADIKLGMQNYLEAI